MTHQETASAAPNKSETISEASFPTTVPVSAHQTVTSQQLEGPDDSNHAKPSRFLLIFMGIVMLLGAAVAIMMAHQDVEEATPVIPITQQTAGADDHEIKAGLRVGFMTIGLPIEEVERRWGAGKARPEKDAVLYNFAEHGITVAAINNLISSIFISTPQYAFVSHNVTLRVGDDVDKVVRLFGPNYERTDSDIHHYKLDYWHSGVHFSITDTTVSGILISQPVY